MKSQILDLIKVRNPLIWVYSEEDTYFIEDEATMIMGTKLCDASYAYDARGSIFEVKSFRENVKGASKEYDSHVEAINDFTRQSSFDFDQLTVDQSSRWDINAHGYPNRSILFMLDIPFYMVDPSKVNHTNAMLTRTLKCAAMQMIDQEKCIVIINHHKQIPIELENFATYVEHPKPPAKVLKSLVTQAQSFLKDPKIPMINLDQDQLDFVSNQLKGLTRWQAEHVLSLSNRQNAVEFLKGQTEDRLFKLETIQHEKARLISKSSIIEILHPENNLDGVGGMDNLKEWIKDTEISFKLEAREEGIDLPKGVLVVGPGGTGNICQSHRE
jgi:hypothetical protein